MFTHFYVTFYPRKSHTHDSDAFPHSSQKVPPCPLVTSQRLAQRKAEVHGGMGDDERANSSSHLLESKHPCARIHIYTHTSSFSIPGTENTFPLMSLAKLCITKQLCLLLSFWDWMLIIWMLWMINRSYRSWLRLVDPLYWRDETMAIGSRLYHMSSCDSQGTVLFEPSFVLKINSQRMVR